MYIDNTGFNRFLLSEALSHAFPVMTLRELVMGASETLGVELSSSELTRITKFVRAKSKKVKVSQGIFNDKWNLIDSCITGYVYLLSYMYFGYYIEKLSLISKQEDNKC